MAGVGIDVPGPSFQMQVCPPGRGHGMGPLLGAVGVVRAGNQKRGHRKRLGGNGGEAGERSAATLALDVCGGDQDNGAELAIERSCVHIGECFAEQSRHSDAPDTVGEDHYWSGRIRNSGAERVKPVLTVRLRPVALLHALSTIAQAALPVGLPMVRAGAAPARLGKHADSDEIV